MLKYRDANDPVSFQFWKGVPHMNEKHMRYVLTVLKEAALRMRQRSSMSPSPL